MARLTSSPAGLPTGLGIDPDSGVISGTAAYGDADPDGGHYTSTVTVQDDAGNTVSASFAWTVTDVNVAPWLGAPLPQDNVVGDAASLQLHGGDVDGDMVTYTASGLPTGLSINAATGLISGTVTQTGSYDVTATAWDGALSASQTFAWDVAASGPEVTLAINGTLDHADDVALLGGGPIPVVVTLTHATPGEHTITLELPGESSDLSSLSQTVFQLINGGSQTVWLTALQPSVAEDDVTLVALVDGATPVGADGKLTNEQVTFEPDIRNEDTPKGMADRIPPRTVTPTTVTLNVTLTKGQKIIVTVVGDTTETGEVKFKTSTGDHYAVALAASGQNVVQMFGSSQTVSTADGKGGNAGKLKLFAYASDDAHNGSQGGVYSNGFSVAAIPVSIDVKGAASLQGEVTPMIGDYTVKFGALYPVIYNSDSGNSHDLDQVGISEQIVVVNSTNVLLSPA